MTTNAPTSNNPPVAFTQEMRFAVVMYGGSSLCIYMNGVAQELLRLVRATAPDPAAPNSTYLPDGSNKLGGSGQVYRRLGQMLSRGDSSLQVPADQAVRTRFVIDVLSGTSAGGINAVYLAKALANDQDLEELKKLWVETADMDVLMNDNQSSADIALAAQKQPRSLLNSRQMYYMLLDALGNMDGQPNSTGAELPRSPYVDELDLYVTATDIVGRKIRLRLADTIARERRHLNTFHFHYSDARLTGERENHFGVKYNPFLAFAARCTSAHPVPFEPVTLSDIDEALAKLNLAARSGNPDWDTFYEEYLQPDAEADVVRREGISSASERERLAKQFRMRPFNDGGVLDNSPFSFAIDSLQYRHSDLPVDRKLLYIEPVPEHPEEEVDALSKPDALENGWLSLSVLPRYQFIREDLERILERNRLIERVKRILQGVERDEIDRLSKQRVDEERRRLRAARRTLARPDAAAADESADADTAPEAVPPPLAPLNTYEFGLRNLRDMIELMGSSWGGYQRLRVAETTDDLVEMIARAAGFDDKSDEFMAIRYLVRTWRSQHFDAYGEGEKGRLSNEGWVKGRNTMDKDTENQFLYKYDLKWRIRRLKFVLTKIDEISCFDARTREILSIAKHLDVTAHLREAEAARLVEEMAAGADFRAELRAIKGGISEVLRSLLIARRRLLSRAGRGNNSAAAKGGNPLAPSIASLGIAPQDILTILQLPTDKAREEKAEEMVSEENFKRFSEDLERTLSDIMVRASADIKGEKSRPGEGILEVPDPVFDAPVELTGRLMARYILGYYYNNFDRYDMISYPILYATEVGEEVDTVEIFRISPEDATHLVTDRRARRHKLAGTSLGNFGAFFDREFRRNDILWGRLDAAERIVTALLSSVPTADLNERRKLENQLIREAQRAILAEEMSAEDKAGLRGLLGAALSETRTDADNEVFREKLNERLLAEQPELDKMRAFLDVCLRGTDPLVHFRDTYKYEHDIQPRILIRIAGRASRVLGLMLEGIAEKHRLEKRRIVWVTRLTQLFWSLVEVAVPGSLGNLIARHWLKLLYVFEAVIVLGGTLLLNKPVQQFGLTAFGITVALHVAVLLLGDEMVSPPEEKRSIARKLLFVGIIVMLIPLAFGILFLLAVMGFDFAQTVIRAGVDVPVGWNLRTFWRLLLLLPVLYALAWAVITSISEFRREPPEGKSDS